MLGILKFVKKLEKIKSLGSRNAGFTIVELLVIVIIITLLTGIIMAYFSSYRSKAGDVAIKGDLASLMVQGAIYYAANGSYGGFCNDSVALHILDSINSSNKRCNHSGPRWAACAKINIPSDGSFAWCVDSNGIKKQIKNNQCKNGMHACP